MDNVGEPLLQDDKDYEDAFSDFDISKNDIQNFLLSIKNSTSPCAIFFQNGKLSRTQLQNVQPMFHDAENFIKDSTTSTLYRKLLNEYTSLAPALQGMNIKINADDANSSMVIERHYELCIVGCNAVYANSKAKDRSDLQLRLDSLFRAMLLVLTENYKTTTHTTPNTGIGAQITQVGAQIAQNIEATKGSASKRSFISLLSEHMHSITKSVNYDFAGSVLTSSTSVAKVLSKIVSHTPASARVTIVELIFNIIEIPLDNALRFIKSDDVRSRVKDLLSFIIKAAIGIFIAYISSCISESGQN